MTKDGIADKVSRWLRNTYDDVTKERVPDDLTRLLDRLR